MKFVVALIVWLGIALVLGCGVVMAAKGSLWLLLLALAAFVLGIWRIGCTSH